MVSTNQFVEENRSSLIELLRMHNTNRLDYNDRKWETLKYFQTIITASLGVIIAGFLKMIESDQNYGTIFKIVFASFNLIPIIASLSAMSNLKRESRLLFFEELQMFKIAKMLGLDVEVDEQFRWLPQDKYLLLRKWKYKYGEDPEHWVDTRMRNHNFLSHFKWLFYIELCLCVTMIFSILFYSPV